MIRERVGATVLRCYPPELRAARAQEILGTLLDASDGSTVAFVRGAASVGLAGWRERAQLTCRTGAARLLADAWCLMVLLWISVRLAGIASIAFTSPPGLFRFGDWLMLLVAILAVSLLGFDRAAGICGVAWIACFHLQIIIFGASVVRFLPGLDLVPLIGFAVMIIAPRHRSFSVGRVAWLAPVAALSVISQSSLFGLGTLGILGLAAVSVIGVILAQSDPRLVVASSLVWASIGTQAAIDADPIALLLITTPLAVIAVTAARWQRDRRQLT